LARRGLPKGGPRLFPRPRNALPARPAESPGFQFHCLDASFLAGYGVLARAASAARAFLRWGRRGARRRACGARFFRRGLRARSAAQAGLRAVENEPPAGLQLRLRHAMFSLLNSSGADCRPMRYWKALRVSSFPEAGLKLRKFPKAGLARAFRRRPPLHRGRSCYDWNAGLARIAGLAIALFCSQGWRSRA
jgi:hypothetical protein